MDIKNTKQVVLSKLDQCDKDEGKSKTKKPILVLINPCSGRGRSLSIYRKFVQPIFEQHGVDHEVFITQTNLRVPEYLRGLEKSTLLKYRSIALISGDGLLHEAVNALMRHPEKPILKHIPLGLVPAGSGNGLAYTLIRHTSPDVTTKEEAIKTCCEQIVKSKTCSTDLVEITFTNNDRPSIWSFLSIGWGLMANIDIESEWLRSIGELRFTIYGVIKSLTNSSQKGRLSYRVSPGFLKLNPNIEAELRDESNSSIRMYGDGEHSSNEFDDPRTVHIEDTFSCLYATNQRYISRDTEFAPRSTLNDEVIYLTYLRGRLSFCKSVQFLLAIEDGSHEKLPFVRVLPVTSFRFQPLEPSKVVIDGELIDWTVDQGPMQAKVVPKALTLAWSCEQASSS